MSLERDLFDVCSTVGVVAAGASWIYWLREIAFDVNKTPPADRHLTLRLWEQISPGMHILWNRHAELYPRSKSRTYAALSLILGFMIIVAATTVTLLKGFVP